MSSIKRTGGGEGVATLCSITTLDSRLLDSSRSPRFTFDRRRRASSAQPNLVPTLTQATRKVTTGGAMGDDPRRDKSRDLSSHSTGGVSSQPTHGGGSGIKFLSIWCSSFARSEAVFGFSGEEMGGGRRRERRAVRRRGRETSQKDRTQFIL